MIDSDNGIYYIKTSKTRRGELLYFVVVITQGGLGEDIENCIAGPFDNVEDAEEFAYDYYNSQIVTESLRELKFEITQKESNNGQRNRHTKKYA